MDFTAIWAAGAILVLVAGCGLFFVIGRKAGTRLEAERQQAAGASAEQTAKRIVSDAERDAQSLRKTAVLEGKEELIRLREEWEAEARKRREDVEGDERRLQERTGTIERKADALEQRERDIKRTASEVTARENKLGERQAELD